MNIKKNLKRVFLSVIIISTLSFVSNNSSISITNSKKTIISSNLFKIDSTKIKKISRSQLFSKYQSKYSSFYENDKYSVSNACRGEFGGAIIFKDKKTGDEYGCEATCAVSINENNGKYFITTSLPHLSSSTKIIEIKNPQLLRKIDKNNKRNLELNYTKKSRKGTVILLEETGYTSLASFKYKAQLYYIINDNNRTSIAILKGNKFEQVQIICNYKLSTYDLMPLVTKKNRVIIYLNNYKHSGYIDIYENRIKINNFKD